MIFQYRNIYKNICFKKKLMDFCFLKFYTSGNFNLPDNSFQNCPELLLLLLILQFSQCLNFYNNLPSYRMYDQKHKPPLLLL